MRYYQGEGVLQGLDILRDDVLPIGEKFAECEVVDFFTWALATTGSSVSIGEVCTGNIFHQCSQNSEIIIAKVFWFDFSEALK